MYADCIGAMIIVIALREGERALVQEVVSQA